MDSKVYRFDGYPTITISDGAFKTEFAKPKQMKEITMWVKDELKRNKKGDYTIT